MGSPAGKIGNIGAAAYTGGVSGGTTGALQAGGMAALKQSNSPAGRAAGAYQMGQNAFGSPTQAPGMANSNSGAYNPQNPLGTPMQFQTDPSLNSQPMSTPGQQSVGMNDQNDQMGAIMRRQQGYRGYA